ADIEMQPSDDRIDDRVAAQEVDPRRSRQQLLRPDWAGLLWSVDGVDPNRSLRFVRWLDSPRRQVSERSSRRTEADDEKEVAPQDVDITRPRDARRFCPGLLLESLGCRSRKPRQRRRAVRRDDSQFLRNLTCRIHGKSR